MVASSVAKGQDVMNRRARTAPAIQAEEITRAAPSALANGVGQHAMRIRARTTTIACMEPAIGPKIIIPARVPMDGRVLPVRTQLAATVAPAVITALALRMAKIGHVLALTATLPPMVWEAVAPRAIAATVVSVMLPGVRSEHVWTEILLLAHYIRVSEPSYRISKMGRAKY